LKRLNSVCILNDDRVASRGNVRLYRRHLKCGPLGLAKEAICGDEQQNRDWSGVPGGRRRARHVEQSRDPVGHRGAIGADGHAQAWSTARLQFRKSARIAYRIAGGDDRQVVAAKFALGADVAGNPPECWVIEEQGLSRAL
jgi:hypothetical protein